MSSALSELIESLQSSLSILNKRDIQTAAIALGQYAQRNDGTKILLGDDCAAIPDGDGYLLLAAEGIWPQLVEQDPWFAGWCAIMVNLSDVAAMGGTAIAVVDALWSQSVEASQPMLKGMQAAAAAYGIPIVGGHTNCHSPHEGLAVSVLGKAQHLISSFEARPGDALIMVINMAGSYYGDYTFWNASTKSNPDQLREQLSCLPALAKSKLCHAGKDISMGGLVGTLLMLCETSNCGATLNLDCIPRPQNVDFHRWLTSFPSFGFLLSVPPKNFQQVSDLFSPHGITCASVGEIQTGSKVSIRWQEEQQLFWDLARSLTGFNQKVSL
ncbi:MAG: sll0787 family AIR synthase-like protein [Phormidesmis sp.]